MASPPLLLGAVNRDAPPERRGLAAGIVGAGASVGQLVLAPVVQATISTAGRAAGKYLALVRGRDNLNNWGPLSAQWITVCSWANVNCSAKGVDVQEILLTAQAVQEYWSNGTYNPLYDVDFNGAGDEDLDVKDIQIIATYFGATGP